MGPQGALKCCQFPWSPWQHYLCLFLRERVSTCPCLPTYCFQYPVSFRYYLATAGEDSQVKLWDLRKLKNFKTISMEEGYDVKSLTFDMSGTYLAMAGTNIQ